PPTPDTPGYPRPTGVVPPNPTAVVIRRPSPPLGSDPRPAPIGPFPVADRVGPPERIARVRNPPPPVRFDPQPIAIGIERVVEETDVHADGRPRGRRRRHGSRGGWRRGDVR